MSESQSKFTHLHVHTHYSLLDGLSKIGGLLDRVKENGMDSIAITDHGNLYGAIDFYQEAKKRDVKPIIGLEAYVVPDMYEKGTGGAGSYNHLILLAKNNTGYKNLMALVTEANLKGFYYKPRIDKRLLQKHSEGLICLSGCLGGELSQALLKDNKSKAKEIALEYAGIFGEDYYIELQQHANTPDQNKVTPLLVELAKELNLPMVATQDSHYTNKDDSHAHDVLLAIQTGNTVDDENRLTLKHDDFSVCTPQEMAEKFAPWPEALENTQKIAEQCNVELTLGEFIFPNFELEAGKTADQMLDELTLQGAKEKGLDGNPEAEERRQYELDIIKKKSYASYFLAVADLIQFARDSKIYTTVRGSAAGSLIAYLSGITNVDPLEFQLPFERFLNPYRPSAPDIDMDFADNRRQEVIEYSKRKYGSENVAQIGTFGTMMARGAVRDVARALGKSYEFGDRIAKLIPMGSQGFPMTIEHAMELEPDLKKIYQIDDDARQILDVAQKLEGTVRHSSVHAAGVVISPKPLIEYVPLQLDPKGGENYVTQYDMYTVGEDGVGLLKFDFLGIRNLAILENAVQLVKEHRDLDIDIEGIPFDDARTFNMLAKGETEGLFQLNGSGMTKHLVDLKPTTIHDINAMIALYRPGPMNNIPEYIARKQGRSPITYFHPKAEKFLAKSYGILVYQDDLLLTALELAGYDWGSVDKFRKAVGKKIPEEMAKQHKIFVEGCEKHSGIPKEEAEKIWDLFEPFQGYGFNKAHAACYGRVAYQTAYMKANYPAEYMCAVLTAEAGDTDKVAHMIAECQRMEIPVLPPDINSSFKDFTVIKKEGEEDNIRFGLLTIKNLGEGVADAIIAEREANGQFKDIEDFVTRVKELNKKSLESLIKTGAFDELGERNTLLENMENLLAYSREQQAALSAGQFSLFGGGDATTQSNLTLKDAEPATQKQRLAWEKELLGLYISGHPLNEHAQKLYNSQAIPIEKIPPKNNQPIKIGAIISSVRKIVTKKGDPMMFIALEDLTGTVEGVVFPRTFEKYKDLLEESKLIMVDGKVNMRDNEVKLICENITELR